MTPSERDHLEDILWNSPEIKQIEPNDNQRGFMLEDLTDAELIALSENIAQARQEQIAQIEQVAPERPPVQRSRERAPRIKRIETVKTGEKFIEKDGRLFRRESWLSIDLMGNEAERTTDMPCGQRVRWEGRLVSASIVLHWVKTGERVAKLPKPPKTPAKPFRAVVWSEGKTRHLGCFTTVEERDAAIFAFKLGVTKTP